MKKIDIETALAEYEGEMIRIGGCSDGFCWITGIANGQHTNGGCKCWSDRMKAQRMFLASFRFKSAIAEAIK